VGALPVRRPDGEKGFVGDILCASAIALLLGIYFAFRVASAFSAETRGCMTAHPYDADVACLHGVDPTRIGRKR
jgi:hypothetical protein